MKLKSLLTVLVILALMLLATTAMAGVEDPRPGGGGNSIVAGE